MATATSQLLFQVRPKHDYAYLTMRRINWQAGITIISNLPYVRQRHLYFIPKMLEWMRQRRDTILCSNIAIQDHKRTS